MSPSRPTRARSSRPPLVPSIAVLTVALGSALGASLVDISPTFVCGALSVFFPLAGPILAADLLGSDITSATLSCFLGWFVMRVGWMIASVNVFVGGFDADVRRQPSQTSTGLASAFGLALSVLLAAIAAEVREQNPTAEWRIHLVACSGCALLCAFLTSISQLGAWMIL